MAQTIKTELFESLQKSSKSITVFLSGASRQSPVSIRDDIRKELADRKYDTWFDVYYPEELFEELLSSPPKLDLLNLENMLAKSVHVVVILLEGPGSIAELGAFANHNQLRDKLVVVVDEKYRKVKSFIALGPIRYLEGKSKSKVIYHNLRKPDLPRLGRMIRTAVRKVADSKEVRIDTSIANPIATQHFLRAAIQVLEPVEKHELIEVVRAAQEHAPQAESEDAETIAISALNILLRGQEVILQDGAYQMTKQGLARLAQIVRFEPDGRGMARSLDKLRVQLLNSSLRRTKNRMRKGKANEGKFLSSA